MSKKMFLAAVAVVGGIASLASAYTEPTTAASPFTVGTPTHATVTSHSELVTTAGGSDNGDNYSTSTIYDVFGATNPSVTGGSPNYAVFDDVFGEQTGPFEIDFSTAVPVTLSGIALYEGQGQYRGVSSFTFYANGDPVISNVDPNDDDSENLYSFAPVVAQNFRAVFYDTNPNALPYPGSTILEIDGIVPEPSSVCCITSLLVFLGLSRFRRKTV